MMKFLRLFPVLFVALVFSTSAKDFPSPSKNAFKTGFFIDIPINISVRDKKMGVQIKPKLTITPVAGGKPLLLKDTEGQTVVILVKGESYKIIAELEGYKTSEVVIDTKIYTEESGNKVIEMEPLPAANVLLRATDENGENVEAIFKVTLSDKVFSGRTTRENPTYKLTLTKSDIYQIEIIASTFQIKKDNFYVEVGEPSRQVTKTYALEKPGSKLQMMVFGDDTEQLLKGAKVSVKTDTETLVDKELTDGQVSIESVFGKNYNVIVEFPGYVKQTFTYKGSLQKEYKIIMQSETLVTMGAFDKMSGKRVPANFKITDTNGQTQELVGKADADIKFKPSGKGTYQIEISHKNYKSKTENQPIDNLSAGKLNFKYQLESLVDDFIILVRDVDDKQLIAKPLVKVLDDAGQEVEIKTNTRTGEMQVQLDKQKEYKIRVEAPEYETKNETLQRSTNKLIGVNLKKTSQLLILTAIDAMTKQPITANYKFTKPDSPDPLSGVSDANRQFRAEVLPQKSYIIEVSADGYKAINENLSYDASKTDKEINRTFEMQKGAYTFTFKVLDVLTKKEISNPKLTILNLGTSQPVNLQTNKNSFSGDLAFGANYSIEATAEGYEKISVSVNSKEIAATGKFEYELQMSKNPFEKYKLVVVEAGNNNKVPNPNLRIFNAKNEPIPVAANANLTEWQAELRNDESYNVEVKADGYVAYRNSLTKNLNDKTITVKIQKVPKHEITFDVVDAFSKKGIVSEFKVVSNGTAINGNVLAGGIRYKTTITEDRNFEIEINANGYPNFKDVIRIAEVVNGVKTIELKKENYTFNFKIIDTKSKKPVSNPKLVLTETASNETATTKFSLENNEFQANLKPDKTYSLAVEAVGFENISENLVVLDAITNDNTNRLISMTAVKKEEKPKEIEKPKEVEKPKERPIDVKVTDNEKKTEPPIVKPEPVVAKKEPPKVTPPPKKEPEKKGTLVEAPMEITDEDFNVKVDVFEKKVVGRRFRLSNLYFEQSSPIIQSKSYPQLDKLVNTIKLNPKLIIEITGHTDNVGLPTQNLYLSEQRAKVVANYLFNKGVPNERIKYSGKGQDEPIAINDTDDNKAKNRRVEFVLRDNIDEKQ